MILFISSKTSEYRYGKQFYFNLGDDRTETSSLLTDPEWQNEDVNRISRHRAFSNISK